MYRRRGITLTEVLVTLFVLAIGLLALLTLFPLAAINMQQSIQDDRSGHQAANAVALADMYYDFRPLLETGLQNQQFTASFFRSPGGGAAQALDDGPSYPIYIDPVGASSTTPTWVGNVPNAIRRLNCSWINGSDGRLYPNLDPKYRLNSFLLQDDMLFDSNGVAITDGGNGLGTLKRSARYSAAYMLRRPRTADPSVVDITVVIYSGRGVYDTAGDAGEIVVSATATGTSSVNLTTLPANVQGGTWLLDITPNQGAAVGIYGPVNAFFYRVRSVRKSGSGVDLELDSPLKNPAGTMQLVVLNNVVDVFEKGPGWQVPKYRYDQ
jgi:hypothetical protein